MMAPRELNTNASAAARKKEGGTSFVCFAAYFPGYLAIAF
jgi:hypothetical protein